MILPFTCFNVTLFACFKVNAIYALIKKKLHLQYLFVRMNKQQL